MISREPAFISVEFSLEEHSSRAKWDDNKLQGQVVLLSSGHYQCQATNSNHHPKMIQRAPRVPLGGGLRFVPNHRDHLHPYGNPLASFASMYVFQTVVFIQLQA